MRIRPLKSRDLRHFNIPAFPLDTRMWVLEKKTPIAYAGFSPTIGLRDLADLYIYVMPAYRRRGYGSRLLAHVLEQIEDKKIRLLSSPVEGLDSPPALFLQRHNFVPEHVEVELVCDLSQIAYVDDSVLTAATGYRAADQMRRLYDDSFRGLPWYQPYADADEVLDDLGSDSEILFWKEDGAFIGFVGVRYVKSVADIEPLGIVKAWQGCKFGRKMLGATLTYLQKRGCREAQLAVWENNQPALNLYRKFGFRPKNQRIFMALNFR